MSALDERDASLLRDMNENANKAIRFMKDRSREDLDSDDQLAYAVLHAIELLGEAARGISEVLRSAHPEIDWSGMIGMRNRISHGYRNVDFDIVWTVVRERLSTVIEQTNSILSDSAAE